MALKDWFTTWMPAGVKPAKPVVLPSDREVYDFCRSIYNDTKGPTPELRNAYDFYKKRMNAGSVESEPSRRAG